ncbi:MAG TPA: NBR1-Ig-like domain-containing protein [Anaerolineales bacterium]|nr:NBR1-Ig-like domain-containing protein [Anaerolineales bacterium]
MYRPKLASLVVAVALLITQTVPRAMADSCDSAGFVSDLTVPDGAVFAPGASFTKTWRLMNSGTCAWTTSYMITFAGGDLMSAPQSVRLPVNIPAGQMVDISIGLKAPTSSGHYKGLWKLSNASGIQFGIGASGNDAFWVDINVVDVSAVIFDFVANAPYAQWKSGAGVLPFPGTSGDSRGYSFQINTPHLEDDSIDSSPALLTVPQNKLNGYIQATYPEFQIQSGDKLQTLVNCEFGATGCYVTFRIDYLTSTGVQKTLWSWREAYDRRFYRANLDLSSLAGQKVRFIFMLLSSGVASGDRAIWGSPRIVRTGTVQPPAPPSTLTPLPALTPTSTPFIQPPPVISPSGCDKASFVTDVTVPDGTLFAPGAAFTKTWRLKNAGSCTWTTAYKFLFYSGEQMSAPTSINIPSTVRPSGTVDLTVNMVAPGSPGKFRGNWVLSNANGALFGISTSATMPIWVEINVAGDSPIGSGYDFTANACSAVWKSGAGILPCPGTDNDAKGFVLKQDAPKLEDGSTGTPGLLTFPQNRYNGQIQGLYPTFTVQPGDRFQSVVGCEFGISCYVTFRLDYMNANGVVKTFWSWREQNDRRPYAANIDLSPLVGQSVRFILTILATGYSTNDRALWVSPRISRAGGTSPTVTPTSPTNDWLTHTNSTYGFQFRYPMGSVVAAGGNDNFTRIDLPFTQGTNLADKYLEVIVNENANPCQSPLPTNHPSETVLINGISFLKQTGDEGAAGNRYQWVAYSTLRNNACISMNFILHSLAAGAFTPPVPEFDYAAETTVIPQMMGTFALLAPTPTPTQTLTAVPPTATATSPIGDWLAYTNSYYGFQLRYPPRLEDLPGSNPNYVRIDLSFAQGTNLREKYLEVFVQENANPCQSPLPSPFSETVTINGLTFLKQTGEVGGAGQLHQWIAYSTQRDNICVSLDFILHSLNPGNLPTPPPVFDFATEAAVFEQMVATFTWLPSTPVPTATATLIPPVTVPPPVTMTALVDALNAQNYDRLKSMMNQTFIFAFWQSQGYATTPEVAIETLKTTYLGPTTHLSPDPGKDLVALLGGLDPYAVMGLNSSNSEIVFVSGWGPSGTDEAILYLNRWPDGTVFWHGVLIAPGGFVHP